MSRLIDGIHAPLVLCLLTDKRAEECWHSFWNGQRPSLDLLSDRYAELQVLLGVCAVQFLDLCFQIIEIAALEARAES